MRSWALDKSGLCLGAVLRKPWRSSFISRISHCCSSGCIGHATSPGPRTSSFTGISSASPDAVEPCPGKKPRRQSPFLARPFAAQEHVGSAECGQGAPHTGPLRRSTRPIVPARAEWASTPISKATRGYRNNDIWIGLPDQPITTQDGDRTTLNQMASRT